MKLLNFQAARVFAIFAACVAATSIAHAGDWRQARVRSVSTLSEVDSAIDLSCAPKRPDQPDLKVAVVTFQAGKAARWRAFNVAADDSYQVGEEIVVNLATCSIARQPQPADTASSAPGIDH